MKKEKEELDAVEEEANAEVTDDATVEETQDEVQFEETDDDEDDEDDLEEGIGSAAKKVGSAAKKVVKSEIKKTKDLGRAIKKIGSAAKKKLKREDVDESIVKAANTKFGEVLQEEEALTEDFRSKSAVIFETALAEAKTAQEDALQEAFDVRIAEETESLKEEMVNQIDAYLETVVAEWAEENKVAIKSGLRSELAEEFIGGLKNLFEESYIEVPAGKEDLHEQLEKRASELEQEKADLQEEVSKLQESTESLSREKILREASESLTMTQQERLKDLVEGVEFGDEEAFGKKVKTIIGTYFREDTDEEALTEDAGVEGKAKVVIEEDTDVDAPATNPQMDRYLRALGSQKR